MRGGMVVVVKAFVEFGCRGRGLGGGSEEGLDKELSFGNMQLFGKQQNALFHLSKDLFSYIQSRVSVNPLGI